MKKSCYFASFLSLLIMLAVSTTAYAELGVCDFGKQTISSLHCFGSAQLNGTTVTGKIFVAGTLVANAATMDSLYVAGDAVIQNSVIKGTTEVDGALTAENSHFADSILVLSSKTAFTKSEIDGQVTVKSSSATPFLELNCGTHINSAVVFDGKSGIVDISPKSEVNGAIKNGQLNHSGKEEVCK